MSIIYVNAKDAYRCKTRSMLYNLSERQGDYRSKSDSNQRMVGIVREIRAKFITFSPTVAS
jgi:hypothetical protein